MYSINKCFKRDSQPDKAIQTKTKIAEGEHRWKLSAQLPPTLEEVSLCVHVYKGFSSISEQ